MGSRGRIMYFSPHLRHNHYGSLLAFHSMETWNKLKRLGSRPQAIEDAIQNRAIYQEEAV